MGVQLLEECPSAGHIELATCNRLSEMPDIDSHVVSVSSLYIICIKMEQDLNGGDKCRLHYGEAGPCEIILTGYI